MKRTLAALFIIAMIALIGSCATSSQTSAPKETEQVTLTATVPAMEPVEGYPWEQTKDAVTIKLTPEPFTHKTMYERSLMEKRELILVNQNKKYEITERPTRLVVRPERLLLKLHAVNNMSHVLRFHGCVLDLKADGKSVPIDEKTVDEFKKAVITPYSDFDVTLYGPTLDQLKGANTIIFAIYDMITQVDEANNPTKRTTFEWIFSVRPQNVTEQRPVVVREERLSPAQLGKLERNYISD